MLPLMCLAFLWAVVFVVPVLATPKFSVWLPNDEAKFHPVCCVEGVNVVHTANYVAMDDVFAAKERFLPTRTDGVRSCARSDCLRSGSVRELDFLTRSGVPPQFVLILLYGCFVGFERVCCAAGIINVNSHICSDGLTEILEDEGIL